MWLLKTEPGAYSCDDLEREGRACWDGVANPVALRNLRAMKTGDRVLVYYTGGEKAVVGAAEVVRAAYPDPKVGGRR
jgi:predicted RNA-binding protein with PUA-like domain